MDESRKAYEAWFKSRYGSLSITPKQRLVMRTYSWAAWQASRAAIEVELPDIEVIVGNYTPPGEGWEVYDAQKTDNALRAAGIKVKE